VVWNMLLALKAFDPSDAKRTRHRPEEAKVARHPVHASSVQYLLVVNACNCHQYQRKHLHFVVAWPECALNGT